MSGSNDNADSSPEVLPGVPLSQLVSALKTELLPALLSQVDDRIKSGLPATGNENSAQSQAEGGGNRERQSVGTSLAEITDEDSDSDDYDLDPLTRLAKPSWTPSPKTVEVAEKYFRRQLDKTEREAITKRFPLPSINVVKNPALDKPLANLLRQRKLSIKNIPVALSVEAVQVRLIDAMGPLLALHSAAEESKQTGTEMNPTAVVEALVHAIALLGNANSQALYQRQRSVLQKLSPASIPLLSKSTLTGPHSEDLFGQEFRKSIKEANDATKDFALPTPPVNKFKSYRPKFGQYNNAERKRPTPYDQQRYNSSKFQRPTQSRVAPSYSKGPAPFRDSAQNTKEVGLLYWIDHGSKISVANICNEDTLPPNGLNQSIKKNSQLGFRNSSNTVRKGGARMVGPNKSYAPVPNNFGGTYIGDRVRFKFGRLGGILRRCNGRRKVDKRRFTKMQPHKPTGATGSFSGHQGVLEALSYQRPTSPRQQISRRLRKQNRWDTVSTTESAGVAALGMGGEESCLGDSRAYSREIECERGLGISESSRLQFLEASEGNILEAEGEIPSESRLICGQDKFSTSSLLELETGPGSAGNRCLFNSVAQSSSVRVSTILSPRSLSAEDPAGGIGSSTNCPSLEKPVLVPTATTSTVCSTDSSTGNPSAIDKPSASSASNGPTREDEVGSMASFRETDEGTGILENVEDILSNSIRPKSRKSYNSVWRNFVCWCGQRNADPLQATPDVLVQYLSYLYSKKLAYRTINLHRSAISFFVPQQNGISIGAAPLTNKFMKGVFNLRPPLPRYTHTWDPTLLISYLDGRGENNALNLESLSKKLVCLLALCKASRSSDICALDISGLREQNNGVIFSHVHLRKTSRIGNLPESFYHKFEENKNLCVVETIRSYLDRTKSIRVSTKLIISTRKPHNPVASRTIARWILDFMGKAGVDISTFKSHSIRSSAASAAYRKGVSLNDIQRSADWSGQDTFLRFYYRASDTGSFASSVLTTNNAKRD